MQNYRSQLSAAYKKENILEKYLSFEQSHGSFFENLTVLVQSIQQTVRELQNNIQFNSQTGTYDMSKLDIQPLERMRKALDKAKSNEATINFDDYQKDYRGGKWVLQKDGKVDVEATNAYNEAVLNGILPKKANAATQEAELLKGILASLKNKKDPITGADISSVQVLSILSGLAFSYRAGRYRGKKLRIPNPDKRKRKKTSGGKLDFNNNKFSGINEMTKDDILNDLPVGWKYTENNGFIHVRDSSGNVRMKFDPPDNVTNFDHIHLFDNNGNPIDINGNVVNRKSSDAHIPYKK